MAKKISALKRAGHKIAIASNQGGVAWEFITMEQAEALVLDVAKKIWGVDAWRVCPFDPNAIKKFPHGKYSRDDESRKPRPGMILSIMAEIGFSPEKTVVVGDQESDRQAAEAAGCSFIWASDFFSAPKRGGKMAGAGRRPKGEPKARAYPMLRPSIRRWIERKYDGNLSAGIEKKWQ